MLEKQVIKFSRDGIQRRNLATGSVEMLTESAYAQQAKYSGMNRETVYNAAHGRAVGQNQVQNTLDYKVAEKRKTASASSLPYDTAIPHSPPHNVPLKPNSYSTWPIPGEATRPIPSSVQNHTVQSGTSSAFSSSGHTRYQKTQTVFRLKHRADVLEQASPVPFPETNQAAITGAGQETYNLPRPAYASFHTLYSSRQLRYQPTQTVFHLRQQRYTAEGRKPIQSRQLFRHRSAFAAARRDTINATPEQYSKHGQTARNMPIRAHELLQHREAPAVRRDMVIQNAAPEQNSRHGQMANNMPIRSHEMLQHGKTLAAARESAAVQRGDFARDCLHGQKHKAASVAVVEPEQKPLSSGMNPSTVSGGAYRPMKSSRVSPALIRTVQKRRAQESTRAQGKAAETKRGTAEPPSYQRAERRGRGMSQTVQTAARAAGAGAGAKQFAALVSPNDSTSEKEDENSGLTLASGLAQAGKNTVSAVFRVGMNMQKVEYARGQFRYRSATALRKQATSKQAQVVTQKAAVKAALRRRASQAAQAAVSAAKKKAVAQTTAKIVSNPAAMKVIAIIGIVLVIIILITQIPSGLIGGITGSVADNEELAAFVRELDAEFVTEITDLKESYDGREHYSVTVNGLEWIATDANALALVCTGDWVSIELTDENKALLREKHRILNTYTVEKKTEEHETTEPPTEPDGEPVTTTYTKHIITISVTAYPPEEKMAELGFTGTKKDAVLDQLSVLHELSVALGVGGGSGSGGIPGEAVGDGTFQAIIREGEKYLGYPYVWGGASPSTSFDCSGFVCWVYTHSGAHNLPRTTAQGIYNQCAPVSPADAKPGDLIFFTRTYSTSNPVTHIGIYVGNGRMLHCGDPISYASINDSYWKQHFYGFGRLK